MRVVQGALAASHVLPGAVLIGTFLGIEKPAKLLA